MADVRDLLRQAAPAPRGPLDVDTLLARATRPRWRRRVAWWLVAVLAVAVPVRLGLAPGDDERVEPAPRPAEDRCGTVQPVSPLGPGGEQPPLVVDEVVALEVPAAPDAPPHLWGDRVAYVAAGGDIVVCTATRQVVRIVTPAWEVVALAGDGDTLVYTEREPVDNPEGLIPGPVGPWRIMVVDLISGAASEVHRGRERVPMAGPPHPDVAGPFIVWTDHFQVGEFAPVGTEVFVHDRRTGRTASDSTFGLTSVDVVDETLWGVRDGNLVRLPAQVPLAGPVERVQVAERVFGVRATRGAVAWRWGPEAAQAAVARVGDGLDLDPISLGDATAVAAEDDLAVRLTPDETVHVHGLDVGAQVQVQVASAADSFIGVGIAGDRVLWGELTDTSRVIYIARIARR